MSLYSLTPNPDDATPGEGTLHVEVPHWSARIRVLDDRQRIVAGDATTSSPDASGPDAFTFSLAPGIYQVEIALGGQSVREFVPIHPDHTTRLAQNQVAGGQTLHFDSSAPLVGATNTRKRHQDAAARWSREVTWPTAPGGDSQFFLFVRTLEPDPEPGFAEGLKLLDATGRLVTDFADGVRRNTGQGWVAFNADLPPGTYILRRGGRNVSLRFQPLSLAAGWQTQAFLLAERYPRLHSLSLNMARPGKGFDAADASAIAADVLLEQLHSDACVDLVLGTHITSLLERELENPWFGIVAANALRVAQAQLARTGAASSAAEVETRLSRVLAALAPLRDHPDVAALLLVADQAAPGPFWSPPMLRVSLRRVNEHATLYADTVPDGSLTDLVLDDLLINSPWTAWHILAHMPTGNPMHEAGVGHGRPLFKVRAEEASLDDTLTEYGDSLARASAPAAPVYYVANASHESDRQVARLVTAVLASPGSADASSDDPTVQVAQTLIRPFPNAPLPDTITLDVEGLLAGLVADADAAQISVSLDIPLSRSTGSLERLQAQPAGDDPGGPVAADEPAAVEPIPPAVMDAIVSQTLAPRTRDLVNTTSSGGQTKRPSFIEESVPILLDEADRLMVAANHPPPGAQPFAERARSAGERMHHVADELLMAAGYTVLTDPQGRIVFGNGVFRLFLTHSIDLNAGDGKGNGKGTESGEGKGQGKGQGQETPASRAEREAAGQRAWEEVLQGKEVGSSTVPVPAAFTHHAGDEWSLKRTAIHDERSGELRAYLNILHNPHGKWIRSAALRDIAHLLPGLTQAVLLFTAGSADTRGDNIADVEELVDQLEQIVETKHA